MTAEHARRPKRERTAAAVPAVMRANRVLDTLAAAREPMTLAGLTVALDIPKSTLHGLCSTLADCGLLKRYANGTYHLGPRLMELAQSFAERTDLTREFARAWDALALLPEETMVLSVLDGADVVYVACKSGSRALGLNFRIGMRLPATCTASGKAQLATLPKERLERLVAAKGFAALTRHSVGSMGALQRQLREVRRVGYAIDDEETRDGMVCFGAAILDARGTEAAAGVAVSLLKASLTQHQKNLAMEAVRKLAQAVSARLGARVSDP